MGSPRDLAIRRGSSLVLMAVTAGLSAVLNHDIICFVFAPIIGAALLQRQLNAVPFLIALAIASNIGAAATIIGNPQDMMIAQVAHLDFGRYLLWCAVPVARRARIRLRHHLANVAATSAISPDCSRPKSEQTIQPYNRPHTIKGLIILAVVIGLFFSPFAQGDNRFGCRRDSSGQP